MTRPLLLTAAALALVTLHGLGHGWISGRWTESADLQAAADRLTGVPLTVGEWQGEAGALDPRHQAIGEIRGYALRRYSHRRGGAVSVLLVCGKPGAISVHTPDVCYRGAGYDPDAPARRSLSYSAGAAPAEVLTARFRPRADTAAPLAIVWAWNDGGGARPEHPRLAFGGRPYLYKLYVVREAGGDADDGFLRDLLAALDRTLSAAPAAP